MINCCRLKSEVEILKKVVAIFETQAAAQKAEQELINHDLADFSSYKLGKDYEQQVCQEIFFKTGEFRAIITGAFLGLVLFTALIYFLSQNNEYAIILGRLMAGGLPVVLFTGAGIGLAIGGLLTGLYYLSYPLTRDHDGHLLMVLYTKGPVKQKKAWKIIRNNTGLIP